ncbi:integrase catalytic domain-containing protein [Trichonephila clavipes]|nr:integrase catalytic domain-containing protein [Trichonephila clavipes]
MLHEFRLINVRSENNETISFVYGAKSFRSHWNVGAVYIAPKITIAGNMENEKAWDQELPQNIVNKFMKWFNEIQILKDVNVPRYGGRGPSWLKQNSEYWPDGEISCEPQEVNVERKKTKNANVDLTNDAPPLLIFNVSDYDKMIRVFAWISRFVNNCRKDYNKCKEHELSIAEIENSEKQLIRLTQTYYLPDVESLKFVITFIDNDNILRVKSKITERNDESSFLYPILLPDKCEFTKLLIRSIHKKNCHAGIQIMQSLIRERFWIIRARKTIKSILNECFICARFKVKSLSSGPSPLPPDRVNDCAIFEVVGIDLAGPVFKNWRKGMDYIVYLRNLSHTTS